MWRWHERQGVLGAMKTSWVVLALIVSVASVAISACGGKSGSSSRSEDGGAGGQSGGASNQAGSGAGPATHLSECESLCSRTTKENCTSSSGDCLMVCATLTGYADCQSEIDKWLKCTKSSPIACDSSGNPNFTDCETELALVSACAILTPPPKAVAKSCEDYCAEVEAAGCDMSSTLGDCSLTCGLAGNVVSVCQDRFVELVQCQVDVGATCDDTGAPVFTGCESKQLVYFGCVAMEVGVATQTDSPSSGGSNGIK
jgi:hypothetical protein